MGRELSSKAMQRRKNAMETMKRVAQCGRYPAASLA